ncbi:MAG: SCP2 sterol-binding domain-containing protein [Candidatus Dormibacterales bacterium]
MTDQIDADDVSPDQVFEMMPRLLDADKAGSTDATILFDLSGEGGGKWWIKVAGGKAEGGKGDAESPSLTLSADARDYVKIALGKLDGTSAFMQGKLRVKGDMGLAMRMQTMFKRP